MLYTKTYKERRGLADLQFSRRWYDGIQEKSTYYRYNRPSLLRADGSYLAEFLLHKNYEVYGLIRRTSTNNRDPQRLANILDKIKIVEGDLMEPFSLFSALSGVKPNEIFNLGAQSFVAHSFISPSVTANMTGIGAVNLLEAIRLVNKGYNVDIKFYQASSSEMFGKVQEVPQKETTPFYPKSPYASSKVFAHHSTINFRESYGIFGVSGILFNHESPRRGEEFVTKKITHNVAKIALALQETPPRNLKFSLGNIYSRRDWGYSPDYVRSMWMMMQQEKPDTYLIATGENHSVKDFVNLAFNEVDIELEWEGEGILERGINKKTGKTVIDIDPQYFRPADVENLIGDYSKAKSMLGWEPTVYLEELVRIMVKHDLWTLQNSKSMYYPEHVDFSKY